MSKKYSILQEQLYRQIIEARNVKLANYETNATHVVAIVKDVANKKVKEIRSVVSDIVELNENMKRLSDELESQKSKFKKEMINDLFDAADEIMTRVVEVNDFVLTISKQEEKPKKVSDVDVLKALVEEFPDLNEVIVRIRKDLQALSPMQKNEPALKTLKKESVMVESFSSLFDVFAHYLRKILPEKLKSFDKKFSRLKQKYGVK